jgi:hypothetical protein
LDKFIKDGGEIERVPLSETTMFEIKDQGSRIDDSCFADFSTKLLKTCKIFEKFMIMMERRKLLKDKQE